MASRSTRLVNALGPGFGAVLERHHALLRTVFEASGGVEIATEGDAFFVVFRSAPAAVAAAAAAQRPGTRTLGEVATPLQLIGIQDPAEAARAAPGAKASRPPTGSAGRRPSTT